MYNDESLHDYYDDYYKIVMIIIVLVKKKESPFHTCISLYGATEHVGHGIGNRFYLQYMNNIM